MHLEETIAEYFKFNGSGISAVYLFGSQASGKTIPDSILLNGIGFLPSLLTHKGICPNRLETPK